MKRDFLDKGVIVIEQDELDYIDRLGDYYQNNQVDVLRLSFMEVVNGHLVGALEQNAKEDKLEGSRDKLGRNYLEEPRKEVKYLKKEVTSKHKSMDSSEVELLKNVANVR